MKYELFFFKEGNRYINIEELFNFFNYCPFISVNTNNDEVEVKYHNPSIDLQASFHLTKVSMVPDIHRLDPRFLDLDIYLSIDPMMPLYKLNVILDLVSDLCQKFELFTYNILFENVTGYRKDLIVQSYVHFREVYRNKFPMEYTSLNYVDKVRVDDVFKYLFERKDLETYYYAENLYFPISRFVKGLNTGHIYNVVDFVEDKLFVFPPKCDLVFFKQDNHVQVIYFDELIGEIEKYCYDLPGFIHNTKVLDKAGMKKIKKIINKTKFSSVNELFVNLDLGTIIDFR